MIQRRDLLAGAAATGVLSLLPFGHATAAVDAWNAGLVAHLLPTVSHDRILLKASFHEPLREVPLLHVGGRLVAGERTDSEGFFWQFDATGLEPSRPYGLILTDARGRPLCDEWPLATFPAADDQPRQLRLLIFTCAGGHDGLGKHLPISTRIRLLRRGLSFRPDAIIANGDHVYWDLRTRRGNQSGSSAEAAVIAGRFDRTAPVLGSPNEAVLKKAVGPQIMPLYSTLCRSTPVFFTQDDHDYFENDEADDRFISFPPDAFMMAAGRASQHLYYPEFLPDPMRPLGLASAAAPDRPPAFRRVTARSATGASPRCWSTSLPPLSHIAWTERGVRAGRGRDLAEGSHGAAGCGACHQHSIHAAGLERRRVGASGTPAWRSTAASRPASPSPYWQPGWRAQHDRLLQAASAMRGRIPLFVSGDLHAIGETRIAATSGIDLAESGGVGAVRADWSAGYGSPSFYRGSHGVTTGGLVVDEVQPTIEENGYLISKPSPDDITLRFFVAVRSSRASIRWSRFGPRAQRS